MPHLSRPDADIYYEEHGSGKPLVLTYGLAGNTTHWQGQVEALTRDHRLILWDQRGHGRSSNPAKPESYGLLKSVDDLRALLDQLGIERATVGGQSMGAGVATRFTLAHPDRTDALLIVDSHSASGLGTSPERDARRRRKLQLAECEGMGALAELAMREDPNIVSRFTACPQRTEEIRREIREMFLAMNVIGFMHSATALANADDISERLPEIQVPTLLIAGEHDPALPSMRFVQSQIRGSILKIIPDAGHYSNLDNPREFNAVVSEALGKLAL